MLLVQCPFIYSLIIFGPHTYIFLLHGTLKRGKMHSTNFKLLEGPNHTNTEAIAAQCTLFLYTHTRTHILLRASGPGRAFLKHSWHEWYSELHGHDSALQSLGVGGGGKVEDRPFTLQYVSGCPQASLQLHVNILYMWPNKAGVDLLLL